MIPKSVIVVSVLLWSIAAGAQSGTLEEPSRYSFNYTKVVPGMPENASLGAYGNVPVSTAKGVPNISFDIYTLSKGGVSIPISIAYDASGIKYNDIPSAVGMKWSLNAGGSINRSVNGIVDEDFLLNNLQVLDPGAMTYRNLHINAHWMQDSSKLMAKNVLDCSLDNYYYNFPGHSGSMYLDKSRTFVADKEHTKIQITGANHLDSFTIKDDMGNTYIFGSYIDNSAVYSSGKYNKQALSSFAARVSWKLKKIITATRQSINFEYIAYFYTYSATNSEKYTLYTQNGGSVSAPLCIITGTYPIGTNGSTFQTTQLSNTAYLISKIYTDDQEVLFQYMQNDSLSIFKKKLSAIKVVAKLSGDTVRRFSFDYAGDYLVGFNEADRLGDTAIKKYRYVYNTLASFGPTSFSRDMFGYHNGIGGSNSLIDNPSLNKMYYLVGNGNRAVNDEMAASGTLKEIVYPAGGKTIFSYEYNKEFIADEMFYSPGLRVKAVWDLDIDNKVYNKKNFYYRHLQGGITAANMTLTTESVSDPAIVAVYCSDPEDADGLENYYYKEVIIQNIGNDAAARPQYEKDYYKPQLEIYSKTVAALEKKEIFLGDTFHLQKSTEYEYDSTMFNNLATSTWVMRKAIAYMGYFNYENDPVTYPHCPAFTIYQGYDTKHVLKPIVYNLKKVINKEYAATDDSLITIAEHFYYSNPVYLERTESKGSNTQLQTVRFTYPFNYSTGVAADMANNFILAPVLKEEYLINNVPKTEKKNTYTWNTTHQFFAQDSQTIKDVAANASKTFRYYDYNPKAKPLSMGRDNDVKTIYIWDYANELPIAEVINVADNTAIAYTSFEAEGFGGWTLFPGAVISGQTQAITGLKTVDGGVQKTVPPGNYVVSFWTTAGVWVNGQWITQTPLRVKGLWRYYEQTLNNISAVTITGSNLDEIRLYPVGAQMTTRTYAPFIGITSICDVNSKITYYEYDGLGRLLRVRNDDKNILKQYDYRYQTEESVTPVWESIGATRCKPCSSNDHYTTNELQSAQVDVNANSSSYGDTTWTNTGTSGSCTITADWQYTATPARCMQENGAATGDLEREKRDLNPCSLTYNQSVWEFFETNCTACPTNSNWVTTGTYRCAKNVNNTNTGRRERLEINQRRCSPDSLHATRWVDAGLNCTDCPLPENWQATGNSRCQKNQYNSNTGYQENEQQNLNICGSMYRWVQGANNTTSCPLCVKCTAENRRCINDQCVFGVKIYTSSLFNASTGKYDCTYHYEFSGGSWSGDYTEQSNSACITP